MEEQRDLKFGKLRRYISKIDRISICMHETLQYENYHLIREVPELYDDYYVYGFGMIESEFDDTLKKCIEVMISKEPRNDI
jgi:hypothetical protein